MERRDFLTMFGAGAVGLVAANRRGARALSIPIIMTNCTVNASRRPTDERERPGVQEM